ncbi:MAG: hypothetical protein ABIJ00_15215 [Candidatus Eisenbacteria bacterium]
MADYQIKEKDLVIHILNVGFGDNIVVQFPRSNGRRAFAVVDCYKADKTIKYLDKLNAATDAECYIDFIAATHPHKDHILGIRKLLEHATWKPGEFWDSGFRHNTTKYRDILTTLRDESIPMIRVSSGFETYHGRVRVTVLGPSVMLRNRYNTYGIDMNNASIVLRLEHHADCAMTMESKKYEGTLNTELLRDAGSSVAILAGDAEFDSWARVTQEFPKLEKPDEHDPLVNKMTNYMSCSVLKVAHHGSMHSSPLDVYEKMHPNLAVISTKQKQSTAAGITRNMFPHDSAVIALKEAGSRVLTTDGSFYFESGGGSTPDAALSGEGSIVIAIPPGGKPRWTKLDDSAKATPDPPSILEY